MIQIYDVFNKKKKERINNVCRFVFIVIIYLKKTPFRTCKKYMFQTWKYSVFKYKENFRQMKEPIFS